jgi:hypothetical protein
LERSHSKYIFLDVDERKMSKCDPFDIDVYLRSKGSGLFYYMRAHSELLYSKKKGWTNPLEIM